MARLFNEPELIIATHNPGKLREIAQLFRTLRRKGAIRR